MATFCTVGRGELWMAAFAVTALAGCGGSPPPAPPLPDLVPVSGTVTIGDEPLDGAAVLFIPYSQGEGFAALGATDSEGHYDLSTMYEGEKKPGAVAGTYKVWISRMVAADGTPLVPDPAMPPAMQGGRESIPPPYSSAAQTPLKADVSSAGGSDFDFKIKAPK